MNRAPEDATVRRCHCDGHERVRPHPQPFSDARA